jgi:hypothetical protein
MLTRRNTILGAACAVFGERALAAGTSAHDFVAAIYKAYVGKNGNGIALDGDRPIHHYFVTSLADLILKDQFEAAQRNEPGVLDFDPFVDAQDWDIAAFTVAVRETGADKASATVKFKNSGKAQTVVLDLVKANNEWQISNITWTPHDKPNNLRALYGQ